MRRAIHMGMGVLLMVSAAWVSQRLVAERDLLVLAAVSPVILAAASFGALLLVRALRP